MINATVVEALAKEYRSDMLTSAARRRHIPRRLPSVRERLGWSLVGLGARLALEPPRHQVAPQP